jgi:hypothetical protein
MTKAKIALIGCNFVGMSLGLALKRALEAVEVVGHDKDREAVRSAESVQAVDRSDWNLPRTCEGATAIFICVGRDELKTTLSAIAEGVNPNTLIVAVGIQSVAALEIATEQAGWRHCLTQIASVMQFGPLRRARAPARRRWTPFLRWQADWEPGRFLLIRSSATAWRWQ